MGVKLKKKNVLERKHFRKGETESQKGNITCQNQSEIEIRHDIQLALEQQGFELGMSTYTWIFFKNYCRHFCMLKKIFLLVW